jgi:hypothetical protein
LEATLNCALLIGMRGRLKRLELFYAIAIPLTIIAALVRWLFF